MSQVLETYLNARLRKKGLGYDTGSLKISWRLGSPWRLLQCSLPEDRDVTTDPGSNGQCRIWKDRL